MLVVGLLVGWGASVAAPGRLQTAADQAAGHGDLIVIEVDKGGNRRTLIAPVAPDVTKAAALPPDAAGLTAAGQVAQPFIPLWLCIPFVLLLGSIALMPFIHQQFWHHHYPDIALFLGGLVTGYYFGAFGSAAQYTTIHSLQEYVGFIALVGGLYVASGGVVIKVSGRGRPLANTVLLAFGAVFANLVGTTGASMLLIRPFMRLNHSRLKPIHIVFFIFIVSNCGGCLTPIGDPPLYLGFLKGVPFFWTLQHLWPMWLLVNGVLLAMFFMVDVVLERKSQTAVEGFEKVKVSVEGWGGKVCMAVIVLSAFITPALKKYAGIDNGWIAPFVQIAAAAVAYWIAPKANHEHNGFNFEPVKEVGLLFAGIFATMMPALAFLQANGSKLGLESSTQLYFATGGLSAVLDNAPTYLSLLQIAFSDVGLEMTGENLTRYTSSVYEISHASTPANLLVVTAGAKVLADISLAAVFFGAMSYIGNGPNFMVKAIAEQRGVKMPSFFGYLGLAMVFLLPVLVINWAIFVR